MLKISKYIGQNKNTRSSTAKPIVGQPTHEDKTLGIELAILFYEIEYDDNTKEVEES